MKIDRNQIILIIVGLALTYAIFNFGSFGNMLETLLLSVPGLFLAITVHEFGHALAAYKFGDKKNKERMTLNPLKHIDPVGLVALALVHVGWGKPVTVDRHAISTKGKMSIETKESIISMAGPIFNFLTVIILDVILLKVLLPNNISTGMGFEMFSLAILLNVSLGVFNLLPIPPLDGYKIIKPILPTGIKRFVTENIANITIAFIAALILLPTTWLHHFITTVGGGFQMFVLNIIG